MATVLVVDDHPDTRLLVAALLRRAGHPTACATGGRAALDAIRAEPPGLVILDVMMPDVSGFDVLAALRDDARLRAVPVVMYSALADTDTRRRALDLGARDYVVKGSADFAGLAALVERYLGPPTATPAMPPPPRRGGHAAGLRVLLVDDHEDTANLLTRLLRRAGHEVHAAGTVAEALGALAASGGCDVLVSDLGLPDGTGLELMRQVAAMYPVRGIALTGQGGEDHAADCRAAGFAARLVKPVDVGELLAAVRGDDGAGDRSPGA
jgi:CheY-like chemotaxis protein